METSEVEFEDVVKVLERIEADTIQLLIKTFNELKPIAEDLNIAQLRQGKRADESSLPNYSFTSVHKFGKPEGPMILYDKGFFWAGIKMYADESGVNMEGTDIKTQMLELRYGTKIVALSESSLAELETDYAIDTLNENVRKEMGL